MRSEETREIDGLTFRVQQLPGRKALMLSRRLAAVLAPALAKGAAAMGGAGSLAEMNLGNLADAAQMLFEKLTEEEFAALTNALLEGVMLERDGKLAPLKPVFDTVMQGKILTAYKLLGFSLEVNFGNFTEGLGGLVQSAMGLAKTPGAIPAASTGPSGG